MTLADGLQRLLDAAGAACEVNGVHSHEDRP